MPAWWLCYLCKDQSMGELHLSYGFGYEKQRGICCLGRTAVLKKAGMSESSLLNEWNPFAVHLSSLGLNVWIFKNFKQLLQLKLTHNTSIVHPPLVQMKYQRAWIRQKYFLLPEMTGCRYGLISTCHVVLHSRFIFYLERAKQSIWTWLAITNLQSICIHSLGCLSQRGSMVLFHNRFEGESTKCSRPRSLFSPSFLYHTPFSPSLLSPPFSSLSTLSLSPSSLSPPSLNPSLLLSLPYSLSVWSATFRFLLCQHL